jgi:hypothetical protein
MECLGADISLEGLFDGYFLRLSIDGDFNRSLKESVLSGGVFRLFTLIPVVGFVVVVPI